MVLNRLMLGLIFIIFGMTNGVAQNSVRDTENESKSTDLLTTDHSSQLSTESARQKFVPEDNTGGLMFKNGFFADLLFGYNSISTPTWGSTGYQSPIEFGFRKSNIFALGLKLGNKWYFGKGEKYRFGFQCTWVRTSLSLSEHQTTGSLDLLPEVEFVISPVSPGFTNVFKFNDWSGLEINGGAGYAYYASEEYHGLLLNADLKYKFKKLTFGIDYAHIAGKEGTYNMPWSMDILSASFGIKI